ncbi:MAG: hypothetical protein M5U28_44505 [Sandaracinaceae bacterium]|nr:hypothetical protein [Sandaracinaceae bacterium]
MPARSQKCRRRIPDTFSTNSGEDSSSGSCVPSRMASAQRSFSARTHVLKDAQSSSFETTWLGAETPSR